ncbi:MAG: lipopolysaccharide assembly protein LapB [Burkholderiales bacterium]|nr:lipopolysaccharide assembly protein LapB [Burkholderiales bacterium]
MQFDFWWFLLALPLFFGMGWVAARIDLKQLLSESSELPRTYFRGLNFLLNDQQDQAIESFSEVVRVSPETAELHFALGHLYRKRGEVERAIRLHEDLVRRPDIPDDLRTNARYELALDFLKAGFLDRAEAQFLELEGTPCEQRALKLLLEIYQQERDWVKAIETSRKMDGITGRSSAKDIANFYCELAQTEITHSRPDAAEQHLREALAVNGKCTRANILLGELAAQRGQPELALKYWKRVEHQDPRYLALLTDRLRDTYEQIGRGDEGLQLLKGYLASAPSLDLLDVVFHATLERNGSEAAYRLVRNELRRNPSLLGLDKLLEAALIEAPHEQRRDIELVRKLVGHHSRNLAMYQCDHCGFRLRQFTWRCPACGAWESYSPLRSEERVSAA